MRLELGYEDLKPEHAGCNPSQTRFNKFTEKVQQAIQIAGEAVFYNGDRSNYNKIYPKKKR